MAVDRGAELPIGIQLAWTLRAHIADGVFEPGQRLPTLRDVADATGVNVNTVRTVYQRLEHEGLIESQQGSGTFVAPAPRQPSGAATIAAAAAREAHDTGVDPRDVAAALYVSQAHGAETSSDGASRRRSLREQIAVLEGTLAELAAKRPGLLQITDAAHPSSGPALLNVTELEEVRTLLVRRLSAAQAAIDQLGAGVSDAEAQQSVKQPQKPTRNAAPAQSPKQERRQAPPRESRGPASARARTAPAGA